MIRPVRVPDVARIRLAVVVDAAADTCELYREILIDVVQEVVCTDDGPAALALAIGRRPELVITEIQVPRVDGLALCAMLRRDPITAGTNILVVTADDRPESLVKAKTAGAHAVLKKPVSPDALLAAIAELPTFQQTDHAAPRQRARYEPWTLPDVTSPAPVLYCPSCARPGTQLRHQRTFVGGVRAARERWDFYACPICVRQFTYRQRTGKLLQD